MNGKKFFDIQSVSSFLYIIGPSLHIDIDCLEPGKDYYGNDLNDGHNTLTASEKECQHLCKENADCVGFTWVKETWQDRKQECWLKSKMDSFTTNDMVVSGPKDCGRLLLIIVTIL